jgi:hypothetical protein
MLVTSGLEIVEEVSESETMDDSLSDQRVAGKSPVQEAVLTEETDTGTCLRV